MDDLLFSSQHMRGELEVVPTVVHVGVVTEVVQEVISLTPVKSDVKIIANVNDMLPPMWTDELRFKQVVYHLLQNAIYFTDAGEITLTSFVEQRQMKIRISDTGIGIAEENINRVFDAFYQVPHRRDQKGLGLGLTIVKNIVQKLGGDITVESKTGEGSTFTFTMPLVEQEQLLLENHPLEEHADHFPRLHNSGGKMVVIVDDDVSQLNMLYETCVAKGYAVFATTNSEDALAYIAAYHVGCVWIDLLMANKSGYGLCAKVRETHDLLELPIIVLTSIMKEDDLRMTMQTGANDFIQKPLDMAELFIRLESLLAMRQSSVEAEMNYLYAQVTPHFVYNTLNTIIGLSYTNIEHTREALYALATYFGAKLNVHYQRDYFVPLQEELELVKAYLYIEKLRFGDRLTVRYDIDETIDMMIPALSLQPFVENAVVHGITKKESGGTIEMDVRREGHIIQIKIFDNGIGMDNEKLEQLRNGKSERIGFANPLKKLQLMKNTSLHLYSKKGEGTTIIINLNKY